MSNWEVKKRFWSAAGYRESDSGYVIELDGRGLKTPAKTPVVVPSKALAEAIVAEWQAQGDEIDPLALPYTRTANSALDKVTPQHAAVADMLAEYGGTDLLCYRAEAPEGLVARQAAAWDEVLDWAAETLGARLKSTAGVMFLEQDAAALAALREQVHALSPFELAAFHDLVSLTGSLVLGFAATREFLPSEDIWQRSRVDEAWQEEQWGKDEEATSLAETKRQAFLHAYDFYKKCND
ncbi:ATPase [Cognatishimia sp. SS12]|uniref:ATP12 family chaperone protein n=1 Tax=Cognatishimia sp. SS12 TaxID=2979465 RepID=UPI00232B49E4|nr:ATP12 family protein [Cognatishimia sp. SS12]MDC0738346.1 ATPase [Cognatishimia sp. SS12]